MFDRITLHKTTLQPALFLAPMAGITHAPFRRLIAEFGGYGALYTEMLPASAVLHENIAASPLTKRSGQEGNVVYQLMLNGDEDIPLLMRRLGSLRPFALDLNLGCPAPLIRRRKAGIMLFHDTARVERIIAAIRECWDGILMVKCRLGTDPSDWRKEFLEKLALFARFRIDGLTVHARFSGDKLKRKPRWEQFQWITQQTDIPLIANGDILDPQQILEHRELFSSCAGLMLGRIAAVRPWVFPVFANTLCGTQLPIHSIDYADVWDRFYRYTVENFPAAKAIGRIKEFSAYYARNFFFGHEFFRLAQGAASLQLLYDAAMAFLGKNPQINKSVSVMGI